MELINIGFGNLISSDKIVSVVSPEAAPIKRMIKLAKDTNKLIDASGGRKTRSVIVVESDHIILSYLTVEMFEERAKGGVIND